MKTRPITAALAILALATGGALTGCAGVDVMLSHRDGKTSVALRPTIIFEK